MAGDFPNFLYSAHVPADDDDNGQHAKEHDQSLDHVGVDHRFHAPLREAEGESGPVNHTGSQRSGAEENHILFLWDFIADYLLLQGKLSSIKSCYFIEIILARV